MEWSLVAILDLVFGQNLLRNFSNHVVPVDVSPDKGGSIDGLRLEIFTSSGIFESNCNWTFGISYDSLSTK
jgi:hypothetical protein